MIRLHRDLDLNVPGIDAVLNLLKRIETMEDEMEQLRRRLRIYEP